MHGPPPLSRPAAIIFDMDGVLVDSEPLWREAERIVYARYGVHLTDEECRATKGLRIDFVTAFRLPHLPIEVQKEATLAVIRRVAANMKKLSVPSDLKAVLRFMEQKQIRQAVCTSSPPLLIRSMEEALRHRFPVTVSAWHMRHPKPHPACYLKALNKLGLPASACWCVEDSFSGMISALAAGIPTIVFPDVSEGGRSWHGSASLVLDSWQQLLEALQAHFPY